MFLGLQGLSSAHKGLLYLSVELSEIHPVSKTTRRALPLWQTPVRMQNLAAQGRVLTFITHLLRGCSLANKVDMLLLY